MRNKLGIFCMIFGAVLVAAALSLFLWNQFEQQQADDSVINLLPLLMEEIQERSSAEQSGEPIQETVNDRMNLSQIPGSTAKRMTEVEIDGYTYVGYLSIPDLGLELPVMSDWSYKLLKKSPCRYSGDLNTDDLVVVAHNYNRHFGYLKDLEPGAQIVFTDMDGTVTCYQVIAVDVVAPAAVDEVTRGDYDLTLVTCTYGGKSRVVAWCDRLKNDDSDLRESDNWVS